MKKKEYLQQDTPLLIYIGTYFRFLMMTNVTLATANKEERVIIKVNPGVVGVYPTS